MTWRGWTSGRWPLALVSMALAGCDEVPITRPAPLSGLDRVVIAVAVALVGLVATIVLLHLLRRGRVVTPARLRAAVVFSALAVAGLATTTWLLATRIRTDQILDGGSCRVMAEAELPRQIAQLSCDTSIDALSPVVVAAVLLIILPLVAIAVLCAADVLHRPRPWWPALSATTAAVATARVAVGSVADSTGAGAVTALSATTGILALTAVACWREVSRHARP